MFIYQFNEEYDKRYQLLMCLSSFYHLFIQQLIYQHPNCSRIMQVIENHYQFNYQQENKVKLENLQVSELFLLAKKVTKDLSNSKISETNLQEKKLLIKEIIQLIVSNISSSQKMNSKKFASFFSIFSYINVVLHCEPLSIRIQSIFYQNIAYYAQKILEQWSNNQDSALLGLIRINLSTLLCSFTSLISQSKKNVLNVNIDKLFTIQLIKNLMQAKFPNEEKFIKHYVFLVRYVSKMKMIGVSKQAFVKSLIYHLGNCSVSRANQISIIHILNKILEQKKFLGKLSEIVSKQKLMEVVRVSLKIVQEQQQENHIKLILSFCSKIIQKLDGQTIVNGEQFVKLYVHLFKNRRIFQRLDSCIQQILSKAEQSSKYYIYKEFVKIQNPSTIEFEILEICTKVMQDEFFYDILQTGYWQKLIKIYQEEQQMSYKKYLLTKIFSNMIENSKRNQDLCQILRNIYFQHRIYFIAGIFQ